MQIRMWVQSLIDDCELGVELNSCCNHMEGS
jgi:hypothetical protein